MNKRTVCARRLCAYVFKHVSTDFANQFEPEWYVPLTAYCRIIFHKCSHVLSLSLSSSYKWYQVSAVQKKDCSLFAISMNSSEEKFRTQGLCCVLCAISSSPSPPPPPLAHRPMCLCVCVNALKHAYKIDFQTNIRNDFWSKNEQNWNGNENARTSNDFRQGNWRKNIQIGILCFCKVMCFHLHYDCCWWCCCYYSCSIEWARAWKSLIFLSPMRLIHISRLKITS